MCNLETDPAISIIVYFFSPLFLSIPWVGIIPALIIVVLLLLCSALISSSEVAYFSLTRNDLDALSNESTSSSDRIINLIDKPRTLLATILISNNFINIGIVLISDYILSSLLQKGTFSGLAYSIAHYFPIQVSTLENIVQTLINVVAVTFLLVLFGEVAPKVYAKLNKVKLARFMSGTLSFLLVLLTPLSNLLVQGTNIIENRLLKGGNTTVASRKDIDEAIELTVNAEDDTEQEVDILKSIVKFGDVSVTQIMQPRVDVVAAEFRTPYRKLLSIIRKSGYSRIPVFDEDLDNIAGILYVKDLLPYLDESKEFEWQGLIRTNVLYVPEAKKINDLLKEFQTQRLHMAIVVDEFGGSSGIVTLEDIMEEIIGEIKDEFDDEKEVVFQKLDDKNFIFEGKSLLNDVCRIIGIDTTTFDEVKGDADSVAGLLLELTGDIPKKDVEIAYEKYNFKIESVTKRRIERIKITLN